MEACRHLDLPIPEQVLEVPKITSSSRRSRLRRVSPQHADGGNSWWECRNSCRLPFCSSSRLLTLLEVLQVFSLNRIICWCGSRSWTFQFLMGMVVGMVGKVFKFPPRNRIHVDIPVPCRGGLQGSRPGQNSAASSAHSPGAADEVFTGFFALFPVRKRVRSWVRARGRN